MKSELKNVRTQLSSRGLSEFDVRNRSDELQRMWAEIENLRSHLNKEKELAIAAVEEKLMPAIVAAENEYAILLKLSA